MLDVSVSYNRYKFLGHEFLTWLWFLTENQRDFIHEKVADLTSLEIGNRVVLENRFKDTLETITIKGDDAGLEEGILSLKKGAVVTELNLTYTFDELEWQFSLKGESLAISGLKTPATLPVNNTEDIEEVVLEKVMHYEKMIDFINIIFREFINKRISEDWEQTVVPEIRKWITK
jgi:hypothetical protein